MAYKLTVRRSLLAGCAVWLLAPGCATTSSETAARGPTKKAPSSRIGKSTPKSSDPANHAKAAEATKPSAPPEPDLPSRLPQPLYCPMPPEVPPETELTIRCAARPKLGTRSVVVHYRVSGTESFTTADAIRSPKGWYALTIKGSQVKGSALQLFVEAYGAGNKVVASDGSDESPNIVLIQKRGSSGGAEPPAVDEEPLARIEREQAEAAQSYAGHRRPAPNFWVAFGIGSGFGWYPTRAPEIYINSRASGWATGGLLHLLPEVGYQWTEHLAFSAQFRYQFVQTSTQGGGQPPHDRAYALLARAYLMSDSLFGRVSNLQLFGTATVGGGTAFRLYVAPHVTAGNDSFPNSDTVYGGPLVAGPGGGVLFHFTNYLAVAGELRALIGFPKAAAVLEAGLSVQLGVWTPGGSRAAAAPAAAPLLEPEPEYNPPE